MQRFKPTVIQVHEQQNNLKKPLALLLLFALVVENVNLFYFVHAHIDENGRVVVHAHFCKHQI